MSREFVLEEQPRLDSRSWLRIVVGVGVFVGLGLLAIPLAAAWPFSRELFGVVVGSLLLYGSIAISSRFVRRIPSAAPRVRLRLSAERVVIGGVSDGETFENRDLTAMPAGSERLSVRDATGRTYSLPRYVAPLHGVPLPTPSPLIQWELDVQGGQLVLLVSHGDEARAVRRELESFES